MNPSELKNVLAQTLERIPNTTNPMDPDVAFPIAVELMAYGQLLSIQAGHKLKPNDPETQQVIAQIVQKLKPVQIEVIGQYIS